MSRIGVLALLKDFNKGRTMFDCIFFMYFHRFKRQLRTDFEFFYSEECTSEGSQWKQVRM